MSVSANITIGGKVPAVTGKVRTFGNQQSPVTVTITNGVDQDVDFTLANNTTAVLWESGATGNQVDSFELLVVESSQNLLIEFTTDKGGEIGDEVFTMEIKANLPFILGSDNSYANYTANFGGGTLDVIDRIRVRNVSGSTANISGFLMK